MTHEAERVEAYQNTIKRLEPDIAMIDNGAAAASISISLKRIADSLEKLADDQWHRDLASQITEAIWNGLRSSQR